MSSSQQLPRAPHPIASAFFDAHDDGIETPTSDNCSKVAAIRHSLGWRTRHASSALYPLTVLPVEGRRGEGEARGDEAASFCVRQVFPRQGVHGDFQRFFDSALHDGWVDVGAPGSGASPADFDGTAVILPDGEPEVVEGLGLQLYASVGLHAGAPALRGPPQRDLAQEGVDASDKRAASLHYLSFQGGDSRAKFNHDDSV